MTIITKNALIFGLLMCAVVIGCLVQLELSGNNQSFENNAAFSWIQMIAPFVIWFLGMWTARRNAGSTWSWTHAFKEGMRISLVFAVISPFVFLAYYRMVNMDIVVHYIREVYRMPEISIAKVIAIDMGVQFASALVFGGIYSALIAFFVRKPVVSA